MRLYFQLVASGDAIQDLEGFEVTDPGQAQAEALRLLAEMRQEDPSAAQDWSGWTLRVTEGSGRVVLSLSTSTGTELQPGITPTGGQDGLLHRQKGRASI